MKLSITPLAESGVVVLPPDIVWSGTVGDFALVATEAEGPAGGLAAANPLRTAVLLLLFTDARAGPEHLRHEHAGDRRGWVGDGFDVDEAAGERPLGSTLWLFRRVVLTDLTGMEIEAEAARALQPLIEQRAVASIRCKAAVDKGQGKVALRVGLYGRDGRELYAESFDLLWRRADGGL